MRMERLVETPGVLSYSEQSEKGCRYGLDEGRSTPQPGQCRFALVLLLVPGTLLLLIFYVCGDQRSVRFGCGQGLHDIHCASRFHLHGCSYVNPVTLALRIPLADLHHQVIPPVLDPWLYRLLALLARVMKPAAGVSYTDPCALKATSYPGYDLMGCSCKPATSRTERHDKAERRSNIEGDYESGHICIGLALGKGLLNRVWPRRGESEHL